MDIHRFQVGPLQTNCYLLLSGNESVIIDPGDDGEFLSGKILASETTLTAILATHGHFDHVLGAMELKLNFNVPFLISQKDEFLLNDARKSAIRWTGVDPQLEAARPDRFLSAQEAVPFGDTKLQVIETPGHTPGSVSFYSQKDNVLLCGDLIFEDGVGRTDFSYSSLPDLLNSIQKVTRLPSQTIIYSGHGDMFTLSEYGLHE